MDGCSGKNIVFDFANTPFGRVIVAATNQGVCYMGFETTPCEIERRFKGAKIERGEVNPNFELLHLMGSDFQMAVWQELLKIPYGVKVTYAQVAQTIGRPRSARAVGQAVGRNPVSLIVPCHRVVASNGGYGGYHWGLERKQQILKYEEDHLSSDALCNGNDTLIDIVRMER